MSAPDLIRAVIHDERLSDISTNLLQSAIRDYERVSKELELRIDYADTVRKQVLEISTLKLEKLALTRATGSIQNSTSRARR